VMRSSILGAFHIRLVAPAAATKSGCKHSTVAAMLLADS